MDKKNEIRPALSKKNIIVLAISAAIVLLGFMLMIGGKTSDDPNVFNEAIFSARRIIVAPILVIGGFALGIYGILRKSE